MLPERYNPKHGRASLLDVKSDVSNSERNFVPSCARLDLVRCRSLFHIVKSGVVRPQVELVDHPMIVLDVSRFAAGSPHS